MLDSDYDHILREMKEERRLIDEEHKQKTKGTLLDDWFLSDEKIEKSQRRLKELADLLTKKIMEHNKVRFKKQTGLILTEEKENGGR